MRPLLPFVAGCLILACSSSASAKFMIDDFATPTPAAGPLFNPDPIILQSLDAGILGGQRDLFLDVLGTTQIDSFLGGIGGGLFSFNSAVPGTVAVLQYDGIDVESSPAGLSNAEALGGIDLSFLGGHFELQFARIEGGEAQSTQIAIEVHSGADKVATLWDTIPDAADYSYLAAFRDFSGDPSVFENATSIEFRINPSGAEDVDFKLSSVYVGAPEPSALAVWAIGLACCMPLVRRRKRT